MAIPKNLPLKSYFIWIFWSIVLCFPVGRIVERFWTSPITDFVVWIGSFWLAAMLYAFIASFAVDIIRLSNAIYPWINNLWGADLTSLKYWSFIITSCLILTTVIVGHINAVWTRVSHYNIKIEKHAGKLETLRIVAASDIHMGTIIAKHRVSKLVNLINGQKPDIVLFAGDIVDEDLSPVIRRNLGDKLKEIRSRYGTYAITGNHEYIGGATPAIKYMENHGVTVLKDSSIFIDNAFYIIGRDDRDSRRYEHQQRKEVAELTSHISQSYPIILLDHQPYHLDKVQQAGIDIQISGHTHHGQLWPLSYITQAIFEVSSGYLRKGSSHFIISNGYGTWGPPVRIGNRPEIIVIDVEFGK